MSQPNTEYRNWKTNKIISTTATGLSKLQTTGDTQYHDGEYDVELDNGDHIGVMIAVFFQV